RAFLSKFAGAKLLPLLRQEFGKDHPYPRLIFLSQRNRMTRPFLMTLMVAMAGVFLASSLARADDTPAANPGAPSTQPDQAAPLRFYGPITAMDTNAKTFTGGDQTL